MDLSSMQASIWIIFLGFLQFLPGSSLNAIDSSPLMSTTTTTTTARTTIAFGGRTTTSQKTPLLALQSFGNGNGDGDDDGVTDNVDDDDDDVDKTFPKTQSEAGSGTKRPTQITSTNADSTTNTTRTIPGEPNMASTVTTVESFVRQVATTTTNTNNNNDDDDDDNVDDNNVAATKGIKDLFNTIVDSGESEQEIIPTTMESWQMTTRVTTLKPTTTSRSQIRSSSTRIMKRTEDGETFGTIRYTSRARKGDDAHTKSIEGMPRYSAEPRHRTDAATIPTNAMKNFDEDKGLPAAVMESIELASLAKSGKAHQTIDVEAISESSTTLAENLNYLSTSTTAAFTELTQNSEEISAMTTHTDFGATPELMTFVEDSTYHINSKSTTQPSNLAAQSTTSRAAAITTTTTQRNEAQSSTSESLQSALKANETTSEVIPSNSLEPTADSKALLTTSTEFEAQSEATRNAETLHTTFKPSPTANVRKVHAVATTMPSVWQSDSGEFVETIGQPEKLVATLMPTAAESSEPQENNRRQSSSNSSGNAVSSLKDKAYDNKAGNHHDDTAVTAPQQQPAEEEQEEYVAIAVDVGGGSGSGDGAYENPARLVQQPKIVYSNSNRIGNLHQQQQEAQPARPYNMDTDNAADTRDDHMSWQQRREYVKQLHAAIAAASANDNDATTMRHDLLALPKTPQDNNNNNYNNNLLIATKTDTTSTLQTSFAAISSPIADTLSSPLNATHLYAADVTSAAAAAALDIGGGTVPTRATAIGEPTTPTPMPLPKTTKRRFVVRTTTAKPPPTIDDYQTITSQAGTHAYLPCNVKQLVKKPISWLRVRDGHILTVDQTTFIADQRFQSIFTTKPERWSLQIKYVQLKDAGTYECQVSTEPKASAIVNLRIVEPRTELIGESTRHVKAGSQVKLHCIISQALEPPLFINWFYNQKQIYLHNRKGWRTEIERIDLPPAPPPTTAPPLTTTRTTTTTKSKSTTQQIALTSSSTSSSPTLSSSSTLLYTSTTVQPMPGATTKTATTVTQSSEMDSKGNDGTMRALMGYPARTVASSPLTVSSPPSLSDVLTNELDLPDFTSASASLADPHSSLSMRAGGGGGGVTTNAAAAAMAAAAASAAAAANVVDVKQITTASLIIPSVEKMDSGNYTCSPSNSAPRTVVLHVLNGEYSASAITSGCGRQLLIGPHRRDGRGFYQQLMQWPNIYNIIMLCGFLNMLLSYGSRASTIWKLSSHRHRHQHQHPVISCNYAHKEQSATKIMQHADVICQQTERIHYGTFGEEYT